VCTLLLLFLLLLFDGVAVCEDLRAQASTSAEDGVEAAGSRLWGCFLVLVP
jgi:hypothetical protein